MKNKLHYLMTVAAVAAAVAFAACDKEENKEEKKGVPDPEGSMILDSITWASVNVDAYQTFASKPDMYTKLYQWNRSTAWSTTDSLVTGWNAQHDTSRTWTNNPCPAGWRLPDTSELRALHNAGSTWAAANAKGNAVAGRFYGPNHATCTMSNLNGCIFLPASGSRSHSSGLLLSQGSGGFYWSATQSSSSDGYRMYFNSTFSSPSNSVDKDYSFTIRCVR